MTPMSTPFSAPSEDFLGTSLLEEDLFSFPDFATPNTISKQGLPTSSNNLAGIDLTDDLVNQIIGSADPSVLSLFDAESGAMFQSMFPQSLPAEKVSLSSIEAHKILLKAEAQLASNPEIAPVVERLRFKLLSSAPSLLVPSPAMTVQATPFLGFGSPEESLAFLMSPESVLADSTSPLMGLHADAFSVQWDSSLFFPSATNPATLSSGAATSAAAMPEEEKPKSKAGRKRKERPNDPDELIKELDMKRQRNTESARRSRVKRMAELDELHRNLASAQEGEKRALEKVKSLEAELEKAKRLLALAGERLKSL
ncbi:hypothetical protein HDU77_007485 [Chytriomyces hyalinus]|nr:hypothetical protein HDU77_007485 [Chytriomyces hyalinus]